MGSIPADPAKPALSTVPTIEALLQGYRQGSLRPVALMTELLARMDTDPSTEVWISRTPRPLVLGRAAEMERALESDPQQALNKWPLLGIPFAVKDNIDVAGLHTTAACPAFAYQPTCSAVSVQLLEAAGAIVMGKTNLDQFATGLVGTRSPYGEASNPFNPAYISGGSSAGSAVATTLGLVAFALGTDTAGSGRVPAAFCNLVGLKPTPGLVNNGGVFPACRSLDCVSVFAHCTADAWRVLQLMATRDDTYIKAPRALGPLPRAMRVGLPMHPQFFGDAAAEQAFDGALKALAGLPWLSSKEVDLTSFHQVAELLYKGPWIAERRAALGSFFDDHGDEMDPTVRQIIRVADTQSATDSFKGQYRLAELRGVCDAVWQHVDALLVPTTPTMFTSAGIAENPVAYNSQLGTYTNFVNLLGYAALALPGPFRTDGLPAGITLIGPGGSDHRLAELGRRIEPLLHMRLGTSDIVPPRCDTPLPPLPETDATVEVAVVGAHLAGLPLNWQLLERSAQLKETTTTASEYRLYSLPDTTPPKPGLAKVATDEGGASIAVEVWEMPLRNFGSFVAEIPAPLGIGTLRLASGREVKGFLCESTAFAGAVDITDFGGWRAYLASAKEPSSKPVALSA